jgi:energy-converting hydrogenase B subunit D
MVILEALSYLLVAAGGTAVVLTRDPRRQALLLGVFGMALTLLFLVLQAPDVALSEVTVGAAALPLMILVALANVRQGSSPAAESDESGEGEPPA